MTNVDKNLTGLQFRALQALAAGSVGDAARACGRSKRTIYRWLQQEHFRAALATLEGAALRDLAHRLVALSGKAVGVIEEKLDAKELAAANSLLRHLLSFSEVGLIELQLAQLEARMDREGWKDES